MGSFRDLIAYKKAFGLSMEIFFITKGFPKEETYSLIDQIRRSSRSVFASIAEAYKKRKYPNHFISKLTDADMENGETQALGWTLPLLVNILILTNTTNLTNKVKGLVTF